VVVSVHDRPGCRHREVEELQNERAEDDSRSDLQDIGNGRRRSCFAGSESADELDGLREELTEAQTVISRHLDDGRARAQLKWMGEQSAGKARETADVGLRNGRKRRRRRGNRTSRDDRADED
jgi:hypothetical protein